jgi:Flp pilus assembly protein TadD
MVVALGLTLAIGGASLLRQGAVTVFVDRAQARIVPNPRSAASEANRALGVDASNLSAYYAKAAALARLDRPAAAQNALLDAARADPTDFVTWTLLGDLAVRTRDFGLARVFYGRAHALNPRDPELARAAAQPPTASG